MTNEVAVDALSALVNRLLADGANGNGEEGGNGNGGESEEEGSDDDGLSDTAVEPVANSPLIDAARDGRTAEVVSILARGDAAHQTNTDASAASEFGRAQSVSELCAADAAVNHVNSDGDTALILASDEGHTETVSVLCAAGAAVDQADRIGRTPLFLAIDNGNLELVQLLSSYGASRTISVMAHARTAVGMATRRGHANLAAWLAATEQWTTPLHHLSVIGAARACALLRGGASLHAAAATEGPSPLSLARSMLAAGDATTEDGSAAALVLRAARPWSIDTHALFPAAARARATALLITGHRLSRERPFTASVGALLDVWVGSVMPHAMCREE